MNTLRTLLWLEWMRTSWVIYGAAVGIALFALVILALPGVTTGFDMLNIPVSGTQTDCVPPDCNPGETRIETHSAESEAGSSSSWSFSRTCGGGAASQREPSGQPRANDPSQSAGATTVPVAVPENLQAAIRLRQFVTLSTNFVIPTLMLLCFWIAYTRESDRGEAVMMYQSPVSGEMQLIARFLYISAAGALASATIIGVYWAVQKSQSLAPAMPIVEALDVRATIHWGNLMLVGATTLLLPNAAFILFFVQMQNAYDLLGGQRLVAFVLIVAPLFLFVVAIAGEPEAAQETSTSALRVLSVDSNPTLDGMIQGFDPSRYRIEVETRTIMLNVIFTALFLIVSGRIWREVEWS